MKTDTQLFNVRLPVELHSAVKAAASEQGKTMSQIVFDALAKYRKRCKRCKGSGKEPRK